jgi:hypothetical protein
MTDKTENPHPDSEGAGIASRKEVGYHTQKAYQKNLLNRKVNANPTIPKRFKTSRLKWNFGQRL